MSGVSPNVMHLKNALRDEINKCDSENVLLVLLTAILHLKDGTGGLKLTGGKPLTQLTYDPAGIPRRKRGRG